MNTNSSASVYQSMSSAWSGQAANSPPVSGAEVGAPVRPDASAGNPGLWLNPAIAGGQGMGLAGASPELMQMLLLSLLLQQLAVFQNPQNPLADPAKWSGRSQEDQEQDTKQSRGAASRDPARAHHGRAPEGAFPRAAVAHARIALPGGSKSPGAPASSPHVRKGLEQPQSAVPTQQRAHRVAIHVMGPATVEVVVEAEEDTSQSLSQPSRIAIKLQQESSSSSSTAPAAQPSLHPLVAALLRRPPEALETQGSKESLSSPDAKEAPASRGAEARPFLQSRFIQVRVRPAPNSGVMEEAATEAPSEATRASPRKQPMAPPVDRGLGKERPDAESDASSKERTKAAGFHRQEPTVKSKPGLAGFDPSSCIQGEGRASHSSQDPQLDSSQRLGALQAAGQSAAAQAQRAGQHTPQGGPGGPSATWFFWAVGGTLIGFCAAGLALLFGR